MSLVPSSNEGGPGEVPVDSDAETVYPGEMMDPAWATSQLIVLSDDEIPDVTFDLEAAEITEDEPEEQPAHKRRRFS